MHWKQGRRMIDPSGRNRQMDTAIELNALVAVNASSWSGYSPEPVAKATERRNRVICAFGTVRVRFYTLCTKQLHSRDFASQAFPLFCVQHWKHGSGLRMRLLHVHVCHYYILLQLVWCTSSLGRAFVSLWAHDTRSYAQFMQAISRYQHAHTSGSVVLAVLFFVKTRHAAIMPA
jgi:hypothetical protein